MTTLITGATRGIGLGLAQAMAAAGAEVIGTCRTAPPEATPEGLRWLRFDAADPQAAQGLGAALGDTALELLICNAGVYLEKGQSLETGYAADLWARTFAVNVTGVFQTVQAALPALARGHRPRIAIIASAMGSDARAPGGSYIYRASKAAALNMGRNLAVDLKPRGIAVGIYHPGWVKTDMGGGAADIDIGTSVAGLLARFEALDLSDTGCFRSYDGTAIPF